MSRSVLRSLVVAIDGSRSSLAAVRWARSVVGPAGGRVTAVHVVPAAEEVAVDLAFGGRLDTVEAATDGVARWLADAGPSDVETVTEIRTGAVAPAVLAVADEAGADAVVVGHHPQRRFGPRHVGHVTADLLRRSPLPLVVVPDGWRPTAHRDEPVTVGVGATDSARAAIRWAIDRAPRPKGGLELVHAYGPRDLFRSDGLLDVIGYHLDPTILPRWAEEDLVGFAEQVRAETDIDVEMSVMALIGRTGPRLVEAGRRSQLLVLGRGEPPFVRQQLAPYLRRALADAPCPVVLVPVDREEHGDHQAA